MSKTVFVFGAGASKAESAPATHELLPKAFETLTNDRKVNHLKNFIQDFYYADVQDPNSVPSFEDILGLLDTALQRQECFSQKWNRREIPKLKENLLYTVCNILNKRLRRKGTIHRSFIRNLTAHESLVQDKYAFFSLNYDILLDNAIAELRSTKDLDLDYGIEFRNFDQDWFRPRQELSVLLLKLHGSLNWIWCPVCNSVKVGIGKKIALGIWTEFTECENDGTPQEPLIILPGWYKSYDNPHISIIWLKAENVLGEAEKVFFIGCSLRESDVRFRYLLKKSLFRAGGVPIVVVDKKRGKKDRREGEMIRKAYKKLFGNIDYQPIGFKHFAENLHEYLESQM